MGLPSTLDRLWIPAVVGLVAGGTHALVETALVRGLGLPLTGLDLAVQAAVWGGGAASAVASVIFAVTLLRPRLAGSPDALIRLSFGVATLGYLAVFFKIVGDHRASLFQAGIWAAPALAASLFALVGPTGRRGRAGWLCASAAAVSAAFCGAQLLEVELGRLPEANRGDLIFAVTASMGALAALAWVWNLAPLRLRFPGVIAAPQAVLAVLAVGLIVAGPPGYEWRSVNRPLALAQAPPPGNFILIVLDTVRADHLDLFGYERETMPLLKARAERGEFDLVRKIHANSSWTPASHGSMFSGLFPWQHGAHRGRFNQKNLPERVSPLRTDIETIAETMGDNGYVAGGVSGNYGYMSGYNFDQGFTHYDSVPGPPFLARDLLWIYQINRDTYAFKPGMLLYGRMPAGLARSSIAFNRFRPVARRAEEVRTQALQWLDANQHRPFFLFMNFIDAHTPYLPVEQDYEVFVPAPDGLTLDSFDEDFAATKKGVPVPPDRLAYYMGQYDAEMREMDRVLDGFLEELDRRGLTDESLVFITSDHGEAFMEHGHLVHGETLYENQIGVPLLVKLPAKWPAGKLEVGPAMQHVDFFATAAATLGFPQPPGLAGTPWGLGREHALAEVYCCLTEWKNRDGDLAAVVMGDDKLIVSSEGWREAYDLAADSHEKQALPKPPGALDAKAMEVIGSREYGAETELTGEETPEMRDKLKSLGYIN